MGSVVKLRFLFILILIFPVSGCFELSSNEQGNDGDESKVFLGSITSSDLDYIDLEREISFFHVSVGDKFQEVFFKIYEVDLPEDLNERRAVVAAWGLVFRSDSTFLGTYRAEDIEVKLFRNHIEGRSGQPEELNEFYYIDEADITYKGVSGWVTFEADGKGEYEIQFQEIVDLESEDTSGPIVTVFGRFDLEPDSISYSTI